MPHTNGIHSPSEAWFALFIQPKKERNTNDLLQQKGFETFLPLYGEKRAWADRQFIKEKAVFPGYLFCRFNPRFRMPVLTTPGVVRVLGWGPHPAPVDDGELSAIRRITESPFGYQPYPFLQVGKRVRIMDGPLSGLEGILLELKRGCSLVVSVTLMQRSMAVEINQCSVVATAEPVHKHAIYGRS